MAIERSTTRRGALAAAGALGAAAALSACGDDDAPSPRGPSDESQAATLNSSLAFEHAVIVAYDTGLPLLRGAERRALDAIAERERGYVRRLAELVSGLGGEPAAARRPYEYRRGFPELRDGADVLTFASDVEERSVRKYLEALPRLANPQLRRTMAEIATEQASHLSLVDLLRGAPPAPHAFVTGTT